MGALTIPPLLPFPVNDEARLSLVSYPPIPTLSLLTKSKSLLVFVSKENEQHDFSRSPSDGLFSPSRADKASQSGFFSSQPKKSCCVITIFNKCTISVVWWSCVYVKKHKNTVVYFSLTSLPLGYISESTNSLHQKSTLFLLQHWLVCSKSA